MLTLIEHGEVYAPQPQGRAAILLCADRIAQIGAIDRRALEATGLELSVVDARGCVVTPGLIDPHEHLLGGSGERGFHTQTPEIFLNELLQAGITTVVGCLGVDTTMKTMAGLLARVKALRAEGLDAFCYTGGYNVPPTTITGSVRADIMFIDEVIGAGETAISDLRATEPQAHELARLVSEAYIGGMLSRKAGITHFHVGDGRHRLAPLRTLLDEYEVEPAWLYPTHVERSAALMEEAIALTRRGVRVDVDTMAEDLPDWLSFYLERDGDPKMLTVSSDAAISSPRTLYEQLRACVLQHRYPLELVLPLATTNTARVLKLQDKGELKVGTAADVLVLRRDSLEIKDVFAGGRPLLRDGRLCVAEGFLARSNRRIKLSGQKCNERVTTPSTDDA